MFTWEKLGLIYSPISHSNRPDWMFEFALAPSVLLLENTVRVFIGCRPLREASGQVITYTGYVDLNPDNLFEIVGFSKVPVLSLGERGSFDEFGTYPLSSVPRDGDHLACYAGWTRCESVPFNVGIGVAISTDGGSSFSRLGSGPVLPYSLDEPFVLSGPKLRKFGDVFYLFYIAGRRWVSINGRYEIVHRIRMAHSQDGLHWTKLNRDLIPAHWDFDEAQASPDVFFSNGRYHMFFCWWIPKSFRQSRARKIGYAWSDDLIHWHRDDSRAGIDVSGQGWDSEMVAYPHVFQHNQEIYMLYIGNEVGRYGFGLARLEGTL